MELGDFLKKTFFAPLGMADTGFSLGASQAARAATLYHCAADGTLAPHAAALGFGLGEQRGRSGRLSARCAAPAILGQWRAAIAALAARIRAGRIWSLAEGTRCMPKTTVRPRANRSNI